MKSADFYNRSNVCNVIVHAVDEVHYGMLIVDLVLFKFVLWRFVNIIWQRIHFYVEVLLFMSNETLRRIPIYTSVNLLLRRAYMVSILVAAKIRLQG